MDLDQITLKELGVNKVGDRVRINSQAKQFRLSTAKKTSQRTINRYSLAMLDNTASIPHSASSPRALHSARSAPGTGRNEKRLSRHYDLSASSSRPTSPLVDSEIRSARSHKGCKWFSELVFDLY